MARSDLKLTPWWYYAGVQCCFLLAILLGPTLGGGWALGLGVGLAVGDFVYVR